MEDNQHETPLLDVAAPSSRETVSYPSEDEQEEDYGRFSNAAKKGLLDYYIVSRVQPGSVKGSMFTLTTAVVGAGIVAVPYAIQQVGLLFGILLFVSGGLCAFFSLHILVLCSGFTQGTSYRDLALAASGQGLARVTQFFVCLNLFGTSVGYLVGGAQLVPVVIRSIAPETSGIMKDRNFWLVFFTIIVVLPLSLFRQLGALRFTSIFAIACISFVTLVAVIKYYEFRHLGYAPTIAYQLSHLPMFDFSMNHLLNAVPLVIFAYTCHPNLLPIYLQLQKPSPKRMYKVMRRSISLAVIMYLILGVYVYFTFGKATKRNFLNNDYRHAVSIAIGSVCFTAAVIITIPLFIHTLRVNIVEMLWGANRTLNIVSHGFLSTFLVLVVLFVAATTDNITSVLQILGATSNPMICFVLPAWFLARLAPAEYKAQKVFAILLAAVLVVISFCSFINQMRR